MKKIIIGLTASIGTILLGATVYRRATVELEYKDGTTIQRQLKDIIKNKHS